MFRLERVEILGFKSFYEKVDLSFPGSVTAVVGPNGCGKSNICDAVAWALGEQSAKTLRGERMDDVIFNGSAKRRPLGMAEVILTLSSPVADTDGNGNGGGNGHGEAEPQVLRIGRRVYREGSGEYFLNDKQVRLKDIQDRLLGTGLGVRAYSVIEQGRIDQVLSTKPQDRRRLIEEAAGISKYRLKKRLAETKLEETRGNLLRLSDIISEIERNVASLKRQASRAARYKEQSESLRRKKAALARVRHDRLREAAGGAERVLKERRDAEGQAAAVLARTEANLVSARLAATEAAEERDRLREIVASLEASLQRDDALLESNHRVATDLSRRRENLERETRDFSDERARSATELAELEERLERAVAEARMRSDAREAADRKASAAAAALAALERDLDSARAQALSVSGERVAARNAGHEADVQASRLAASRASTAQSRERVERELVHRSEEVAAAETEERRVAEQAVAARREVEEWETELSRLARALAEAEAEREAARETLGTAEHRHAALSELLRARQDAVASARGALAAAGIKERGPLSERLRPARGWEPALDLLLRDDLDALVADGDPIGAVEASRRLPSAGLVRAGWNKQAGAPPPAGAIGGWEVAIENFSSLSAAERAALPAAAFVETLPEALHLSEVHPHLTFLTRGRELVRGSLVRAVNHLPEVSGLFALQRQLGELAARARDARERVEALERSHDDLRQARQDREAEMPSHREREREESGNLSAARTRLEERRSERDRLRRELATLAEESETLRAEAAGLESRRGVLHEEEAQQARRESEIRERVETLAAALSEARSFALAAADELSHRRTEAEVAAERRRAAEAAREKLAQSGAILERRIEDALEEGRRVSERAQELAREDREAQERQAENVKTRQARAAELESAARTAADATARAEQAEESARSERSALDDTRQARFEAEVSQTRVRADLEHLIEQAAQEFGMSPSELEPPADLSPETLDAIEREAAELTASLERMGPVNVLAFEEHREESERLEFLTTQRDDLLRSIAELQDSIRKINATSSERFREAFAAINENFKAMFTRLFQGGTAEMRLLDENDLLESGIEIVAQPPGKRNQSILLLSGGEKALAAVALLMAIFRYKPSPFCFLDEVDAPLDEANIDRFTRLLRDMTEETQFIAITHNKRTMETADVMYGVTMEEPGCSKIVSVKFD